MKKLIILLLILSGTVLWNYSFAILWWWNPTSNSSSMIDSLCKVDSSSSQLSWYLSKIDSKLKIKLEKYLDNVDKKIEKKSYKEKHDYYNKFIWLLKIKSKSSQSYYYLHIMAQARLQKFYSNLCKTDKSQLQKLFDIWSVINEATYKARNASRNGDINQIGSALSQDFNDKWVYPHSTWLVDVNNLKSFLVGTYLKKMPTDPTLWKKYYYMSMSIDWVEDFSCVLVAEFEWDKSWNIDASSIDDLYKKIKWKSKEEISKMLKNWSWKYYLLLNY